MRIQSSRAICSQISGLSFDAGCPSEAEASSSPCHQRCLRLQLWSYEVWWMRAETQRLHRYLSRTASTSPVTCGNFGPVSGRKHAQWLQSKSLFPLTFLFLLLQIKSLSILLGNYAFNKVDCFKSSKCDVQQSFCSIKCKKTSINTVKHWQKHNSSFLLECVFVWGFFFLFGFWLLSSIFLKTR